MAFSEAKVKACVCNLKQPAARRCKNGCIFEALVTFCEIGTLIANIYDLQVSIDFFFNGHARLCSGLLKYDIFTGKSQNI
jgi:hypothetical protein